MNDTNANHPPTHMSRLDQGFVLYRASYLAVERMNLGHAGFATPTRYP